MKKLTPKEEEVMQIIWEIGQGTVREIMEHYPPPPPKYATTSSVVRILEERGFVSHKAYGRTHVYFPIVKKEVYKRFAMQRMVRDYFDNSVAQMVSFMAKEEQLTPEQIAKLTEVIEKEGDDE
jgi:predicted transcriptional regulator